MKKAYIIDARLENGKKPREYHDPEDKVLVWPDLVYIEFIALLIFMALLTVWSIVLAAPLEEPANAAATPNPSNSEHAPCGALKLNNLGSISTILNPHKRHSK